MTILEDSGPRQPGRKRTSTSSAAQDAKRIANKVCRVCGDKAFSYNFNVITCESCKAFFRRNAFKENEIRCPFNEECEITTLSRRFCQRCRLVKCFEVGMKKEWIMSDEARLEKKARVEENRERRLKEAIARGDVDEAQVQCGKISSIKHALRQRMSSEKPEDRDDLSLFQNYASPDSGDKLSVPSIPSIGSIGTPQSSNSGDNNFMTGTPMPNIVPTTTSHHDTFHTNTLQPQHSQQLLTEPLSNVVNQVIHMPISDFNLIPPPSISSIPAQNVLSFADTSSNCVNNVLSSPPMGTNNLLLASQDFAANNPTLAATAAASALAQAQLVVQAQQTAQQMVEAVASLPPHQPLIPQQISQAPLSSLAQLPPQINLPTAPPIPHVVNLPPPQPEPEMITISKEMFLKLVNEAGNKDIHHRHQKCTCDCRCGYYPKETVIVDQVLKDVEREDGRDNPFEIKNEGEVNQACQDTADEMQRNFLLPSENSTVSWLSQGLPTNLDGSLSVRSGDDFYDIYSPPGFDSMLRPPPVNYDPDFCELHDDDRDLLNNLLAANNATWGMQLEGKEKRRHEQTLPSKENMVNMAEGAIRRLVKMLKKVDVFHQLTEKDQMEIIKRNSMHYLVLRGAMAYDPGENAWKGPTQNSGFTIKMDAMQSSENLLEHSIRFYTTFKDSLRSNESVMLILGQLLLFRVEGAGYEGPEILNEIFGRYKRCLKRQLYQINCGDIYRTRTDFNSLWAKLDQIKEVQKRALGMVRGVDANNIDPLLQELFAADPSTPAPVTHSKSRNHPKISKTPYTIR
ncbi:unnamed protein product, partial [Mesorhabditis spiculigera]